MGKQRWPGAGLLTFAAITCAVGMLLGGATPADAQVNTILVCVRTTVAGGDPQGQGFGGAMRVVPAAPCAAGETLITLVTAVNIPGGAPQALRLVAQVEEADETTTSDALDALGIFSGNFDSLVDGCVVLTLSVQASALAASDGVAFEAHLDGAPMSPGEVSNVFNSTGSKLLSYTFFLCGVAAGNHDWDVQWRVLVNTTDSVTVALATVVVYAP